MKLTIRIEDHESLGEIDVHEMEMRPRFAAILFHGLAEQIERDLKATS